MKNSKNKKSLVFSAFFSSLLVLAGTASAQVPVISTTAVKPPTVDKSTLVVGQKYFITGNYINVRNSNTTIGTGNVVGKLSLNDEVELYDVLNAATPLVQVRVLKSVSLIIDNTTDLFVSKDFLATKASEVSKYFIIQNVATERTRVYERCLSSPNCPHRMILETEMVVGRPEEGSETDPHAYKTWLGHSRISEWVKFYQDNKGYYPHWYKAGQSFDTIPKPISKGASSLISSRKWMKDDGKGEKTIYGAFGWYAAKLTPEDDVTGMNYQWMHGTIGWGQDGSAAIDLTRGFLINLFSNPGSHGCTRLENRAIAYLQSILAPGTDVYRVYARESTREKELRSGLFRKVTPLPRYASNYERPKVWNYILLTDEAQQVNGLTADATTIIERAIPVIAGKNLLERGRYEIDGYPNAVRLNYQNMAASGRSGDRYEIDSGWRADAEETAFRGYYLVDEGRLLSYQHPTSPKVKVSGFSVFMKSVPQELLATGAHHPPKVKYRLEQNEMPTGDDD